MSKKTELTFEIALEKIRTLVSELESGELSLEDSLVKFKEGSDLLDGARKLIAEAELRVSVLSEDEDA